MTPGIFVRLVADTLQVEPKRVVGAHRHLVLSGAFGKSGRGRSAHVCTLDDAAVLVLAVAYNAQGWPLHEAAEIAAGAETSLAAVSQALLHGHEVRIRQRGPEERPLSVEAVVSATACRAVMAALSA